MLYLIPGLRCHKHPIAELIRIRNQPWLQPIRDGQPRHDLEILSKIRTFEADSGTGLPPDTDTSSESELWTKEYSKIRSGYKGPGLRYGYTSDNLHQMTQIVGLVKADKISLCNVDYIDNIVCIFLPQLSACILLYNTSASLVFRYLNLMLMIKHKHNKSVK